MGDEPFSTRIHDFVKQLGTQDLTPKFGCVSSTGAFALGFAVAVCLEGGGAYRDPNPPGYGRTSPVVRRAFKIGPLINIISYSPFFSFLFFGGGVAGRGSGISLPSAQKETPYH